ncbi:MAG: nitroreductase [Candidatus Syntrophonatronum acetioxidans]|uniref:Nitroreductase n=1 Tax=Candidatus Syntrophonatronum acetioxidans TaxID=1795816 RepID=A0A424YG00_9FIRM|nr:MAG: nitroreductase [Candidatus Syntrophonatronum acetioxidans]
MEEVVNTRKSVRKYRPDPVDRQVLTKVLEVARKAPSWKNLQCWRYILVEGEGTREKLAEALPSANPARKGIVQAPLTVVLCANPEESGVSQGKEYYLVDAGITMEHLVLAAAAQGLGTCWVAWFQEEPVKELLGIPDPYRVVAMTPLGYPAQEPKEQPRKELSEIVFSEEWGKRIDFD